MKDTLAEKMAGYIFGIPVFLIVMLVFILFVVMIGGALVVCIWAIIKSIMYLLAAL